MCICEDTITTSSIGLTGSVTHACRMWVVIGSGTPAMSLMMRAPAGRAVQDLTGLDVAAVRPHRRDAVAVRAVDAGDLGVRVDLRAARVRAACEAPDDRVVADDAARRVVQRAEHRMHGVVGHLHRRAQRLDLVGPDEPRVDAVEPVDLGAVGHDEHRAVRVGEREMTAAAEEDVEVEVLRQPVVELQRRVVEPRALRRLVVRAQDRRVAPGGAGADVVLLEHRDVGDAVLALR